VNILNHYRIRKVSDENAKACLHGESSWITIFLCYFCGSTNSRDCWVTNWS
jgi:hypothetical protein